MEEVDYGFNTIKVKGGYNPKDHNYSVQVPIYQTASFEAGSPERIDSIKSRKEVGFLYARGGNPTTDVLEKRIAQLHGVKGAIAVSSGAAAISYTILTLLEGGGRIITTNQLYGGTVITFENLFTNFGIKTDYVRVSADIEEYAEKIREDTKAIFVESISNPTAIPVDIEALAKLAHDNNIPLIVDNTIATPYLLNPFDFGADIVVYSATKGISGHGSAVGGLILQGSDFEWENNHKFKQFEKKLYQLRDEEGNEQSFLEAFPAVPFLAKLKMDYLIHLGSTISPLDSYLILLGLETITERITKQVENTEKLVNFLKVRKEVEWVSYPTVLDGKFKYITEKYYHKGAGGVFSFGISGGKEKVYEFINSLNLISYQVNLGDTRTLISNSAGTTHGALKPEFLEEAEIPQNTLRVSVGLEEINDLIKDIEQSLTSTYNK